MFGAIRNLFGAVSVKEDVVNGIISIEGLPADFVKEVILDFVKIKKMRADDPSKPCPLIPTYPLKEYGTCPRCKVRAYEIFGHFDKCAACGYSDAANCPPG